MFFLSVRTKRAGKAKKSVRMVSKVNSFAMMWRPLLQQLGRIKDPAKLAFAKKEIEAIANDPSLDNDLRRLAKQLLQGNQKP